MTNSTQTQNGRYQWLLILVVFLIVSSMESVAVQRLFTSQIPGGNDFYPRWAGARALLVEGRDPYSPAVTRDIEAVLDPQQRRTNSFSFAYPLHVVFVLWPLVFTDYTWAQAIWIVCLQWLAIGSVVLLLRLTIHTTPSPLLLTTAVLGGLFFYPVARSILLGQFTLHVLIFLAGALLLLQNGRDGWAGILLAATSIKPQMVLFIGPFLLLWAWRRRRRRFIAGLLGGGAGMFLASLLLFPRWPLSFIVDLGRYSERASGLNPVAVLLGGMGVESTAAQWVVTAVFLLMMAWAWWRALRRNDDALFYSALFWTIIVTLLATFQTGSTNQVLLLIPAFFWLRDLAAKAGWVWTAVIFLLLLIGPWLLFLTTISGNYENPLLLLPLPLLALAVLLWRQVRGRENTI